MGQDSSINYLVYR